MFAENERKQFAVGCIISLKKRTGVHSSLVVFLHNNINSIHTGRKIIVFCTENPSHVSIKSVVVTASSKVVDVLLLLGIKQ